MRLPPGHCEHQLLHRRPQDPRRQRAGVPPQHRQVGHPARSGLPHGCADRLHAVVGRRRQSQRSRKRPRESRTGGKRIEELERENAKLIDLSTDDAEVPRQRCPATRRRRTRRPSTPPDRGAAMVLVGGHDGDPVATVRIVLDEVRWVKAEASEDEQTRWTGERLPDGPSVAGGGGSTRRVPRWPAGSSTTRTGPTGSVPIPISAANSRCLIGPGRWRELRQRNPHEHGGAVAGHRRHHEEAGRGGEVAPTMRNSA